MRLNNWDVFLSILIGFLAIISTQADIKLGLFGILLGMLLVFIIPGYVLSVAFFPGPAWSFMEGAALTLGLSLAISVLGGILLYAVSIPLTPQNWAIFFSVITVCAGLAAVNRRIQMSKYPARRRSGDTIPLQKEQFYLQPQQILFFGLAAIITLAAIGLAQNIAKIYPQTEIVQLWLLPGDSEIPSIRVGAFANESAPLEFSLWLERGGYTVQKWEHITLTPGERWETKVPVDIKMPGTGPLRAYLYLYNEPDIPYRYTTLWLDQLENK